jgi:hypothetical protein
MWLWPVNEMIKLVSGMPAAQFGDESFWVRGSELVQSSSVSVRWFRLLQVEDRCFRQSAHTWLWGEPYVPPALYPPGRFLVLITVRSWVDPRTVVLGEGLSEINPWPHRGIEPATFWLVPQPTALNESSIWNSAGECVQCSEVQSVEATCFGFVHRDSRLKPDFVMGSVCLKVGITQNRSVEVLHVELVQNSTEQFRMKTSTLWVISPCNLVEVSF